MSSELPSNKTNNPLFYEGAQSPRSKVMLSTARENVFTSALTAGAGSFGSNSSSNPFYSDGGIGASGTGVGEGRLSPVVEAGSSTTGSAPSTLNRAQQQQQQLYDERDDDMASSRAASLPPLSSAGYNTETDDDDAQSAFRPPSPGAVSRPLLPLMASHSPLSCGTASATNSRSNSLANSPLPVFDAAGQAHSGGGGAAGGRRNITIWVPGASLPVRVGGSTFQVGGVGFLIVRSYAGAFLRDERSGNRCWVVVEETRFTIQDTRRKGAYMVKWSENVFG